MKATRQQKTDTIANMIKEYNNSLVAAIKALQKAEVNAIEADFYEEADIAHRDVIDKLDDVIMYAEYILKGANLNKRLYISLNL